VRLDDFRETLPADRQGLLQKRLDVLSSGTVPTRQFVINLWAESRLSEQALGEMSDALLTSSPELAELVRAARGVMQQHTLEGGPISCAWPSLYGRVDSLERFYDRLVAAKLARSRRQADLIVSRLCSSPVTASRQRLRSLSFGSYVLWATFHPTDVAGHPFDALSGDADYIRCRLGLDPMEQGKDVVLMVYALPTGTEPLFPTVADGYAGDPWLHYFRPAGPHEQAGTTMPWEWPDTPCPGAAPCREVVHGPVTGEQLAEPPRMVIV
jgi:hypothetical protein